MAVKLGRNSFGAPLIAVGYPCCGGLCFSFNEGGRWFSAVLVWRKQLILAFAVPSLRLFHTVHWHVDWGLKPRVTCWKDEEVGLEGWEEISDEALREFEESVCKVGPPAVDFTWPVSWDEWTQDDWIDWMMGDANAT